MILSIDVRKYNIEVSRTSVVSFVFPLCTSFPISQVTKGTKKTRWTQRKGKAIALGGVR